MAGKIHLGNNSHPLINKKIDLNLEDLNNTVVIGNSQTKQSTLLQNIFIDLNKGSPPQAAGYSLLKQNCLF